MKHGLVLLSFFCILSLMKSALAYCENTSSSKLIATEVSTLSTPTDRCKAFMAANPDLVCLSLKDARALDIRLAQADHDAALAKLRARRLGLTLGCGPTVSGFVTDTWSTKALPAISCGLVWGWRW